MKSLNLDPAERQRILDKYADIVNDKKMWGNPQANPGDWRMQKLRARTNLKPHKLEQQFRQRNPKPRMCCIPARLNKGHRPVLILLTSTTAEYSYGICHDQPMILRNSSWSAIKRQRIL